ncbi:unnamed protein product [Orchesella dallaii]|uniref:Uncharacterized protein n=1 Tax=Orchesella dallaii TaxID=48710 RepID=A0ABP1Q6R4_9HEXA
MDKHNSTAVYGISNLKFKEEPEAVTTQDTSQSIIILLVFFIVILSLFAVGMGLSYLCYKRALKKRKERERREQRLRAERLHPYRAIAAARRVRGIPNLYAPNPKDENSHLLDASVVPVHVQLETDNQR